MLREWTPMRQIWIPERVCYFEPAILDSTPRVEIDALLLEDVRGEEYAAVIRF